MYLRINSIFFDFQVFGMQALKILSNDILDLEKAVNHYIMLFGMFLLLDYSNLQRAEDSILIINTEAGRLHLPVHIVKTPYPAQPKKNRLISNKFLK